MTSRPTGGKHVDRPAGAAAGLVDRGTVLSRFVMSPLNYWGSLVGDSIMPIGFLLHGVVAGLSEQPLGMQRAAIASTLLLAGWLFWSFLEYVLHRWILHGPRSLAQAGHAAHHRDEEALLASPLFVIPSAQLLLWWLLSLVTTPVAASFFFAGAAAGYAAFSLLHHIFHHDLLSSWSLIREMRRTHDVHHRMARFNYGTTTTLWDRVFDTYRPARSSTIRS